MRLIKLDATSSTNDFLKELISTQEVVNYTIVTAEMQTSGRGQMGAKWESEYGKNLMFSILIKEILPDIDQIYSLNVAVALAVISALKKFDIPELSIKWPNDIMSGNKKIGGILIENTIRSNGEIISIVGIGLNINQIDFTHLPKASSIAIIMKSAFDKDKVLREINRNIQSTIITLQKSPLKLWSEYKSSLFKIGMPMPFEDKNGTRFMGIIQGVNSMGKLELLLENDTVRLFEIREIQMLY